MSKILFSPIGGSDPIRNFKDGSMLHICRNYRPDKVILYLSDEMLQYHKMDNRYLYCLDKLGELINHHFNVEIIERAGLKEAQSHEIFYNDFMKCIADIESNMTENDELYLNISSGTPAMKSALIMLSVLTEYPLKSIQISTPLKRRNYTEEDMNHYEVEEQWECNEDNMGQLESRCEEVHFVNLTKLLRLKIIREHMEVYDYSAAYHVAKDMAKLLPVKGLLMLEQALERLQLNTSRVNVIAKQTGYQPMPITKAENCAMVEYILLLQIKLRRKEYDDFVRAITPVIVLLFEKVLEKQCCIDLNQYCTKKNGIKKWDRNKLKNTKILDVLYKSFGGNFTYGPVYSIQLKELICEFSNNAQLNQLVEGLRNTEEHARNRAAHTIVSITKEQIMRWTGSEPEHILEDIKNLAQMTNPKITEAVWNSYDVMNEKIWLELEEKG